MTPSKGSLKAARCLNDAFSVGGIRLTDDAELAMAVIIDRDTAMPEMLAALQALPLDTFSDDMETHDAADFVDHAGQFLEAMMLAKVAIRKVEGDL